MRTMPIRSLLVWCAVSWSIEARASEYDTLVICPAQFREALAPWIEYRAAQGRTIGLLTNEASPEALRTAIRRTAKDGALKTLLLVGDAEPAATGDPRVRARSIPAKRVPSRVIHDYGGERTIASDNFYADLDDDGLPDLAVGRLTADTPQELSSMVRRIIAYERSPDSGPWRRQLNFVTGGGGFGPFIDGLVESATRQFLATGVPPEFHTTMTQANWQSPYCPDPRRFGQAALARLNEGCLFWVYLGHGEVRDLQPLCVPGRIYRTLGVDDAPRVDCRQGPPVALMFCCYVGAFDAQEDCLAEELLRRDGGPVAVFAGSRVTMPYGMAALGVEMLHQYFRERDGTLGEIVLKAKRNMASDTSPRRRLIDPLAALASPTRDVLAEERRDHIELFNLLGDPLLRVRYPQAVTLTVPRRASAGSVIEITGQSTLSGRLALELVMRRDRLPIDVGPRVTFDDNDSTLAGFDQVYAKANETCLASTSLDVTGNEFRATLRLPENLDGPCHVRAFIAGQGEFGLGAADIDVSGEK